jgi:hypothetical protein
MTRPGSWPRPSSGGAAVVELIILICPIGWGVLGHAPAGSPTMGAPVAQTEPEPVPVKIAPPPRPTLVANRKEAPAGSDPPDHA